MTSPSPRPKGNARPLECVGGPLDGELLEVPRDCQKYTYSPDRMREVAVYVVREVPELGPDGRALWARECLAYEGKA